MILIMGGPRDIHARSVASLIEKSGRRVRIVDSGQFGNGAFLSYPIGGKAVASSVLGGEKIHFDEVRSVWYRRPRLGHVANNIKNPAVRSFCRQEWANLIEGLFINSSALFVNPVVAEFAAVKPRQLELASAAGLSIPDTLITNDSEGALAFIERHGGQVIHKALTAPRDRMIDTRLWNAADRDALPSLSLAPTIFQAVVQGPADIRATVVGNQVFAAKISTRQGKAGVDSRLDMDAPYEAYRLPGEISDRLLAFMRSMDLVYGTIDLKINDSGEYVFFEVNPQGQFLYVEILTGLPITETMAALLSGADSVASDQVFQRLYTQSEQSVAIE